MKVVALALFVGALALTFMGFASEDAQEVKLAEYSTTLQGRMASQRHNAELGLDRLNGHVVGPGETFSFNAVVGTHSRDQGYRKAPVSYNGQLVDSWGGGVCQTSSTLYNAALLAGMEILERNRHRFAPSYVPAGRDAAVAYNTIDLKFRNPYPYPVRILGHTSDDSLVLSIVGREQPKLRPEIVQEVRQVRAPQLIEIGRKPGTARLRNSGKPGYEVVTYRVVGEKREFLSADSYPAMHKVIEYLPSGHR